MRHEDLEVWKESMSLAKKVHQNTKNFPKDEIYGITSQIRRAAVSIPSNIAEGSARQSDKELIQFIYIALGSLAELQTQLILSKDFGYLSDDMESDITNIRRKLLGLVKYLKGKAGYPVKDNEENYTYE
jgi:four helix bundle protein